MITGFFIQLLFWIVWVITSPLRLLQDVSISSNFISAIGTANGYISSISFVVPVYTLLSILAIMVGIEGGIILFKLINWTIRKIPTIN